MNKSEYKNSLRRALSKGLITMQALVLVAFTLAAAFPLVNLIASSQGLDDGVIDDIVKSLQRTEAGELAVDVTRDLQKVVDSYPQFWFYAVDADTKTVSLGAVPEQMRVFPGALLHISSANLNNVGTPESPYALVRSRETKIGKVWIMTAGGPPVSWRLFTIAFSNPFFVGLLLFLTIVTLLTIPQLIRRSLRGVEQVAAEAERIDMGQHGLRLSSTAVPAELIPLVQAFNAALERLDQGIARQQRFMADAAHELRTPIAILQTRLELLPPSAEQQQLLIDVARLSSMANQLLDLHRMDLSPADFRPIELVDMVSQVTADLAPLAIAAGSEIAFEAPRGKVAIVGDAPALSRAIANLIQNALAHGGPKVAITVEVTADRMIRVCDTGPGIPPEHREEIFWPFHRLAVLQQGAGLGLSLVQDIVQRHGGRISVSDMSDGGACFEISLPAPPGAG
ncbi:Signal transduction histidine kinase [Devosia sp. YR412]|uniref:sensor histidine kinase n=1 Tax=Devosia sp. YR412 TaxID=1881030 RepID=UPI0008C3CB5B|nr:HAMP domain-containing sensor histidine kinase [Devosia sp. YR412]SEP79104.1 Signal transduction histidine kinase [Devosia sp. YR412]